MVFATIEDWLKVVVSHLVLIGCIEAMKKSLSSLHPVVALACKKCGRQYLDYGNHGNQRHTTYLCAGCGPNGM